jgi:hypothetical protein
MAHYYVNNRAQDNGDHEVHVQGCSKMPSDKKYLGDFYSCQPAVVEAKRTYWKSNGCYWCSRDCHTT